MWVRLFPIFFFVMYLTFTVLFFSLGPFDYPVDNPVSLYTFLALAHVALFAGYWRVAFREPRGYRGDVQVPRLVLSSAVATLLLLFPTSKARTGNFMPDVVYGIFNPGEAYASTYSLTTESSGLPLIEYIRILLGPLLGMLLPLAVFYWERLDNKTRILATTGILSTVALFLAMGTNKAIADTVLLLPWMVFAAHKAGTIVLGFRRIAVLAVCSVAAFVLFLAFFGAGMLARAGSPVASGFFPATGSTADTDNFLIRHLGAAPTAVVMGLDIYLTPGYYALSLSLREPFVPMYGVGNSTFLYRQAARITGDKEILKSPYPVRIEKYGWDSQQLWATIYPWIASDVSFPGTIVVIYFIGRLFALSWIDTLGCKNPFAVVIFSQFVIMLFYFPANNQLLQSGEGFAAFWVTLILWWRSRRAPSPIGGRIAAASA
jgi:hypothetical protein